MELEEKLSNVKYMIIVIETVTVCHHKRLHQIISN
jgi:hypothetical protein